MTPSSIMALVALSVLKLASGEPHIPELDALLAGRAALPDVVASAYAPPNTFVAHRHRVRDGPHSHGSLRKRCTRKKPSQIVVSTDDDEDSGDAPNDDDEGSSSSQGGNSTISDSNHAKTGKTSVKTMTSGFLKKNCVTWGWISDDGDHSHGSTGSLETPAQLDKSVGTPALYFGAYGHVQSDTYKKGDESTYFDGKEVLPFVDYLKGTGSIAVLSIMPVYGWGGLTSDDNTQALQIVKVLKEFDDAGIEVYLRFGHEMNYYTTPNSDDAKSGKSYYAGGGKEFIEGWNTVAAAVKDALPQVKMFWSPNIGDSASYAKFWPGKETVDLVGVDYYPNGNYDDLASHVQNIHDTYAKANDIPFHIGETGVTQGESQKAKWLEIITSEETCNKLSHFEAVHWFNYHKGGDFRVAQPGAGGMTAQFVKIME